MIWVSIILASAVPMVFVIGKALRVSRERCPQVWPLEARPSEIHLLFLSLRFRPAALRFDDRARRSAGRREGLLVGLGLLGLAVAPLLTFRHRRSLISLTNAQPRTVG